jgi:hypothetical protein
MRTGSDGADRGRACRYRIAVGCEQMILVELGRTNIWESLSSLRFQAQLLFDEPVA